jgi:hypothetical protein
MWKLVYNSVRGTSHVQTGQPCQDHCAGRVVGTKVVATCSDGAGSAELSHLGSRLAVERFLEEAEQSLGSTAPDRETIECWVDAARDRILEEASAYGVLPRQLACTLLGAIVGDAWAALVQIGDGVIVFDGEAGYEFAFWPDNGEYANTTRFLTDEDYRAHLRIEIVPRPVGELALLTDGLQMLALDFAEARVHGPFFAPLFRTVRDGPDEDTLRESLLEFMDSRRVNDRTDDDKTLLLATRNTSDAPAKLTRRNCVTTSATRYACLPSPSRSEARAPSSTCWAATTWSPNSIPSRRARSIATNCGQWPRSGAPTCSRSPPGRRPR